MNLPPASMLKNNNCGIYQILNIVNGKYYVGASADLRCRRRNHRSQLRSNKHRNRELQSDYNQYGDNSFVINILEFCRPKSLRKKELKHLRMAFFKKINYNVHFTGYSEEAYK